MVKYIDLDVAIQNSNSAFLKKMPKWVISLLKKIIHQDEMNRILNKYEDCYGVDFLPKIIEELQLTVQIEGEENLPADGRCFFAANHPFGFVDGLILTNTVGKKYGKLKAIGNDSFLLAPHLKPIIAAVNVFGSNPKAYLLELENLFESDSPITHFPAGVCRVFVTEKLRIKIGKKALSNNLLSIIAPLFLFILQDAILIYFISFT